MCFPLLSLPVTTSSWSSPGQIGAEAVVAQRRRHLLVREPKNLVFRSAILPLTQHHVVLSWASSLPTAKSSDRQCSNRFRWSTFISRCCHGGVVRRQWSEQFSLATLRLVHV
jgi:hypothetical protein